MRQQRQNHRQRTLRPRWAARQIHDQRAAPCSAHRTAQCRKRRVQQPIGTHPFRQPVDHPFTNHPGSLRCHVSSGQSGASRGHNQICALGVTLQRPGNQIKLIGQGLRCHHTHSGVLQRPANSRPGEVGLLPTPAAVADRQHNGPNIGKKALSHAPSLTGFTPRFQELRFNCFLTIRIPGDEKIERSLPTGYQPEILDLFLNETLVVRTRQTL
jgi:hypothetical protein